jgi:hypothetical protein
LTVRWNDKEARVIDCRVRSTGRRRSSQIREALRELALRETLCLLHEDLGPHARAAGRLTEDDILRGVS